MQLRNSKAARAAAAGSCGRARDPRACGAYGRQQPREPLIALAPGSRERIFEQLAVRAVPGTGEEHLSQCKTMRPKSPDLDPERTLAALSDRLDVRRTKCRWA